MVHPTTTRASHSPGNAADNREDPGFAPAEVRTLTTADLSWALRQGWDDFQTLRGDLLFLPFVYAAIGFLAAAIAFQRELFPFIFPLAAGFALVGPVAAAGFYEIARRREEGLPHSWFHFFDPMAGRSRIPLLFLAAFTAGLFLLWVAVARGIYEATLAPLAPASPAAFLAALFTTPEGWRMILIGNAVGAGFALIALIVSAFSMPMVVDRAADPLAAVLTSVKAFARNPAVMLRWGITVAAILLVATLPLFLGLVVALPVLGYATWHLYTRAVVRT